MRNSRIWVCFQPGYKKVLERRARKMYQTINTLRDPQELTCFHIGRKSLLRKSNFYGLGRSKMYHNDLLSCCQGVDCQRVKSSASGGQFNVLADKVEAADAELDALRQGVCESLYGREKGSFDLR